MPALAQDRRWAGYVPEAVGVGAEGGRDNGHDKGVDEVEERHLGDEGALVEGVREVPLARCGPEDGKGNKQVEHRHDGALYQREEAQLYLRPNVQLALHTSHHAFAKELPPRRAGRTQ